MNKSLISIFSLAILLLSCQKQVTSDNLETCGDSEALNYQYKGQCYYLTDELDGRKFDVTTVVDETDISEQGSSNEFSLYRGSNIHLLGIGCLDPLFSESNFQVNLRGSNFTLPEGVVLWRYFYKLSGSGSVANDGFYFEGTARRDTDHYRIVLVGKLEK